MAVVFISPKQRQRVFFMGITAAFVLFIVFVFLAVFLSKPISSSQQTLVFNKPKVNIDMAVFDSAQFKNLQPLDAMQIQYSYTATGKNNKQQSGFISASSEDEANIILKSMQLTAIELKEVAVGRGDPFIPYYQTVAVPVAKTK